MKNLPVQSIRWLIVVLLGMFSMSFVKDKVNYKELLLEAESYFLYEEYTEALPLYERVLEKYPDNHYLYYKIGRCYLNIPYLRQQSLTYLQKAIKVSPLVTGKGSFNKDEVSVDAIFYLGDAYRVNNQPETAIATYEKFITQADTKIFDLNLAHDEILSCKRAIISEKNPVGLLEKNLGEPVNSRFSEINPVVSDDETLLVYAIYLPFYQAVYVSKKVNGVWEAPVNIIPDLKIDGDCIPVCLSGDGTELYFYRSDEFHGELYVSKLVNGSWTGVHKLNQNINTKYWESQACLSPDGKTLYFSSNRPGGYGGLDIYQSERSSGDDWGPPVNCGPMINTAYNDNSPYLTADGKRMYFSSFGHETIGGYDVFYSDRNASGTWQKAINPGYPFNTADDDLFYCPVKNGKAGYTYRYDPKGKGKFDICRFEITASAPTVLPAEAPVKTAEVTYKSEIQTPVTVNTKSDALTASGIAVPVPVVKKTVQVLTDKNTQQTKILKQADMEVKPIAVKQPDTSSLANDSTSHKVIPVNAPKSTNKSSGHALGLILAGGAGILLLLFFLLFRRKHRKSAMKS